VELFVLAGLPAAAGIINFVVLTSAASSANSGVFSTSRMLYGLALKGDAPNPSTACRAAACRPRPAVLLHLPAGRRLPDVGGADLVEAFTLVTTVSAILFMFVWSLILLSYIVYRRQRAACMPHPATRCPAAWPCAWPAWPSSPASWCC
jgi:D-serine/D-alanine/glycine transporter